MEMDSPRSPEAEIGHRVEDLWEVAEPQLSPSEKLNSCFEDIPVASFPRTHPSRVIEIPSDASLAETVEILSKNKILSAPIRNVEAPEDASWMDKYIGIVEFAGIAMWLLSQSDAAANGTAGSGVGSPVSNLVSRLGSFTFRRTSSGRVETTADSESDEAASVAGSFFETLTSSEFYKNTKVGDISGSFRWAPFLALQMSDTFLTMLLLLSKYRMKSLPVVEVGGDKIENIITQSSVMHMLAECVGLPWFESWGTKKLSELGLPIMKPSKLVKVNEDQPVLKAFQLMREKGVGGLPVMDTSGTKAIGNISIRDVQYLLTGIELVSLFALTQSSSPSHPKFTSPAARSSRLAPAPAITDRASSSSSGSHRAPSSSPSARPFHRSRRAVYSTNHSSDSDVVAEDMSDIPHETARHCQVVESEKTEVPPRMKNVHGFNECSSLKNLERTKCRWSSEEDELLTQLVNKHGTKNWQTISCAIPDRNAHACLSRWKYILDPAINKEAWSQQEELRLIRAHQIYGNKWCKMVKHFPGRTNNALKEHWRGSMKRKLDSYLASGLLEQVPELHENLSVPQSSQSDVPKDSKVSSDGNGFSSILSTRSKLKQELGELSENAHTSVGESSDFINSKTPNVHSAKVSESIIAKPRQCARARKKLDLVSTPVKIKFDVPPETTKHRQEMESEKIEVPLFKKNAYSFKEGSSLKNPERAKGRWLAEEDEILTEMVTKHGLKNWQTIASAVPGRDAKQCRIRWTRSLDPAINKEDWTEQEELKLIRAHQIYGSQWLKMIKHFPGRTNHALKEHWRGRMKGKLNYYLASGLLEQVPDLEDLSVPESSQLDIPKDSPGSSETNRSPSSLPTRPKSKTDVSELGENADTSEEEISDCDNSKGLDAHVAKVSEKMIAKSKQRARARKKLDFLSTPVELKVCTAAASCQRPPPEMKQTTPAADTSSPSDVCQDIPQNVPSEHVDMVTPTTANNHPNDIHSWPNPDPCSLEIHEANSSDLLDMSYCDGLMIDSPLYPHVSSFI